MEDFKDIKEMAGRRKRWILIPFLLVILAGLAYVLWTPKLYEAKTLILVQAQKVPEDFVQPIISTGVEDRLQNITQQVTSRTNLEKIIKEYELFGNHYSKLSLNQKVEILRERITIDIGYVGHANKRQVGGVNSFSIAFLCEDPVKARDVTNALASNFIGENLRIRESQAIGTSDFISDELESVRKQLSEKEIELKRYRQRYMGGLPGQLQTNLITLERLQAHLDQLHNNLRDNENRRVLIQAQIAAQAKVKLESVGLSAASLGQNPRDIKSLRKQISVLESRYTAEHPDIIRLKATMAKLEAENSENDSDLIEEGIGMDPIGQTLKRQLLDIELEIESLRAEIPEIRSKIEWHQTKVADTPKRELELITLNRDYENLKEIYNSLLKRKLEAKVAVSMEKKQKGEKFRVIDPAVISTNPVKPNLKKVILLTLFLGLSLGVGMAFLAEVVDKSYKTPGEVERGLQLPVLMSMPIQYTNRQLRVIKIKKVMATAILTVGFFLSTAAIFFVRYGMEGADSIVSVIKNVLPEF